MSVEPSISVVVVNWNAREELRACLRALADQQDDDHEVIVVDNGSTDGSQAMVRSLFDGATLVETGANLGFAEACNRGIEHCRGRWVFTLNNDARVEPDCLAVLRAAAMQASDEVGMLQPKVVLRSRPPRLNSTGVLLHVDASANDRDFGRPLPAREEPDEILCVTAGAGLYRRRMLAETRLAGHCFDPAFFMYFEDLDLGWRCRLAGWTAHYVPAAVVEHAFQKSSARHGRHFVTRQCMRNRVRSLLKNGSPYLILRSLPRTGSDLLWLLQHDGGRALARWLRAAGRALAQRRLVSGLARLERRALERRWLAPRPTARRDTGRSA